MIFGSKYYQTFNRGTTFFSFFSYWQDHQHLITLSFELLKSLHILSIKYRKVIGFGEIEAVPFFPRLTSTQEATCTIVGLNTNLFCSYLHSRFRPYIHYRSSFLGVLVICNAPSLEWCLDF